MAKVGSRVMGKARKTVGKPGTAALGPVAGDASARRWPDVVSVPNAPVRGMIASGLFRALARRSGFAIAPRVGHGSGPVHSALFQLRRPRDFYHRVGSGGLIGFGESYQAGD